ncbi:MAG TPA: hypothetical protein DCM14_06620 [Clostridiales bacterium UBA8153]|nr:hypothetical protein [Clostridiales bacterium UBA8153]
MGDLIFWLALVLFWLASQALKSKSQGARPVSRPRDARVPDPSEGRAVSRRVPAAGRPGPSLNVPSTGTTVPVTRTAVMPPSRPANVVPVLDRPLLAQAVVLSEILGKPRGLRPWRPQGWRH